MPICVHGENPELDDWIAANPGKPVEEYEASRLRLWELLAERGEDGGVTLSLTMRPGFALDAAPLDAGATIRLELTDEDRQALANVFGAPEGAGFYRTARKDRP